MVSTALTTDINLGVRGFYASLRLVFFLNVCIESSLFGLPRCGALRYLINSWPPYTRVRTYTQERVYNTGSLFLIIIPIQ